MDKYDKIMDLSKRRGIIWNSFEIYGGSAGFYDYGPIGCSIKNQIENIWRNYFIVKENHMEIETTTIGIKEIFIASGHLSNFSDPICECLNCHQIYRADHLIKSEIPFQSKINSFNLKCPECNEKITSVKNFNLMFKTEIGPTNNIKNAYLRPETAQGIFINFQRISNYYRNKLPFGCVQIGKSYRNEISPRQGILRLREFTQAECEIFVDPENKFIDISEYENITINFKSNKFLNEIKFTIGEALKSNFFASSYIAYYIGLTYHFLTKIGINKNFLRFRQHEKNEMAHYAIDCWDAEVYVDRFGWIEIVGIADRTNYDLKSHIKNNGINLSVYKEFENPKKAKFKTININEKEIKRLYKKESELIISSLKKYSISDIIRNIQNKKIYLNVNDNKIYEIPLELVNIKTEEKIIYGRSIIPHVIEPSYGIDRILYSVLDHSYKEEELNDNNKEEKRIYLDLKSNIAPYKVSIFPLISKDQLSKIGLNILNIFKSKNILSYYDESGTIGKRYRRSDEIGIPYSITIDFQTIEDETITIRYRNSMKQERVKIKYILEKINELNKNDEYYN